MGRAYEVRKASIQKTGAARGKIYAMYAKEIYNAAKIKPVLNQIELHPFFQQKDIRQRMNNVNVKTEGWAPLAQTKNNLFNEPVIQKAATKYKKTPAQIILRWQLQAGYIVIPGRRNE